MRTSSIGNFSQEDYRSVERERLEQDDESNLPWLDEAEIVSLEYDNEDPWFNEG